MSLFADRADAGKRLARHLAEYSGNPDAVVVALPRGGVPVAAEVARSLGLPLDIFLVRKLGVPGHEELAMGAIASGGGVILNREIVDACGIAEGQIRVTAQREEYEMARRETLYRGSAPRIPLTGRDVLLVDDGLATGATMRAAVRAIRLERPASIVAAVPVGAVDSCQALRSAVDHLFCPQQPEPFGAVGAFYDRFGQTTDADVIECLHKARNRGART